MSEISAEEKKRILRERRQQKFAGGGAKSRLEKITGHIGSQLSTDTPLNENADTITGVSMGVSDSTNNQTKSKIEEIPTSHTESKNPELDILKKLASAQSSAQGTPNTGSPTPDLFSLLGGGNGTPDFNGLPFAADPIVDNKMLKYHNYLVNKLKMRSLLIKWLVFLLPMIYLVTRNEFNPSFFTVPEILQTYVTPENFFNIFITFEVIATSIYFQQLQAIENANKVDTLQNNSMILKILSFVPQDKLPISNIKGWARLGFQYWDVFSMFLSDLCFVLVVLGLGRLI